MAKDYGNERLGGPPGLYDSPNWDRETEGGIVQRIRVPAKPEDEEHIFNPAGPLSLNDSDNSSDIVGAESPAEPEPVERRDDLAEGIPFCKPMRGNRY